MAKVGILNISFRKGNDEMEKTVLSLRELASRLSVSYNTAYSMVLRNELPYFKIDRQCRFQVAAIDKWISDNTNKTVNNVKSSYDSETGRRREWMAERYCEDTRTATDY